ncbi:SUMF1/EgtB/PvdO family nonheme iron enzyme [Candidatus Chloroploca asiatica]|uniref:Sulfatase-modifying factor enzyme-like domain-containing protein n=1 Tax=Candidatus Chloroploca asiatica TaxID=1506545 RepID=A0A2H3KIT7_9CHLR|nr:SUMF1/EgtB/PvdO family nonheme iron enzyme [Candidatus Chloroploca asiatica]PDV97058.1 hypothetical protein A9Q02_19645 [Candidatus Chloroploca asiatica]
MQAFATRYPQVRMVVTCRTRAFTEELQAVLGWPVTTLAPLTLGQVRAFVPAWYGELVAHGHLAQAQAKGLSEDLIATIVGSPRLRAMAASPLLVTLMALLLFRRGTLPRDRPTLYEQILELLLGEWDKVRDGQNLADALGRPDWTTARLRPLLDRLSYEAHAAGSSEDGRGRLGKSQIRDALIEFFEAAKLPEPWGAAGRCLDYMEHRSGLLTPDGPTSYVFAHLTLQEHCAGRHMLLSRDPVAQVLARRGDDRWREPLFLGVGVVQATNPFLVEKVLRVLVDRREQGVAKPLARWYRDLMLAAELGVDRDWTYLAEQQVDVAGLQAGLRDGLVTLLADRDQPLPVAERVRAGFLLGDLGDPRVPVTVEEWQRELARIQAGDLTGYFCKVEPGTYWIGSSDDDPDADDEEQPLHQVTLEQLFWIARYPITNAQWQAWGERRPYGADHDELNRANQPVVGLLWPWCNDFCTWLSTQISATVRLPTEQEWEASARGGDMRCYPWGDEWRDDHAAITEEQEEQETRGWGGSVPVGCYPAGAAPCGAVDMTGNVWEWTASEWQTYSGAATAFTEEDARTLRGGSYRNTKIYVQCWVRITDPFDYKGGLYADGFRVVVAPLIAP